MKPQDRIIVALDVSDIDRARMLAESLRPHVGGFKIGLEFMTSSLVQLISSKSEGEALALLRKLHALFMSLRGKVFWDAKFADIPNTVARASRSLEDLRVKMFDVHASAGHAAMAAAVANKGSSLVIAVTVLTSLTDGIAESIFGSPAGEKVLQFARGALQAGCDGIVCSPQELKILGKERSLAGLLKIAPGIRSMNSEPDDQARTMTAAEAIRAGANYLVIGRPITDALVPTKAAQDFSVQIGTAL